MTRLKIDHINSFQIFQIFKFGSSLLISIALAKSYLSLFDIGVFESFIFFSSSISFFWITGISQGLLASYTGSINHENHNKALFFSTFLLMITFSVLSVITFCTVYLIDLPFVSHSIVGQDFLLFLLYILLNPSTFLIEFILLLEKKFNVLLIYGILTIIIPLFVISIAAFNLLSVSWCFYGLIFWSILKFIYLINLILKYSRIKFSQHQISQLFKLSSPLIITSLLVGSAAYIDSLIISFNYDRDTFVIFRYGAREFPLFLLIANAFGTSMIPQFANSRDLKKNLDEIKTKSKRMIQFFFPFSMVLLLSSEYIFTLVFSQNFEMSHRVFDIYLLLIISRFIFPQTILMGLKRSVSILKISFLELIVNIIASLILIQYFGYLGVAYGTVIAYFFEKIMLVITIRKKIQIMPIEYIATRELVIYSSILIAIFIVKNCLI